MDEELFCKYIGEILRAARTSQDGAMSQYRLAELAGLTRRYIQMLESGRQGVTLIKFFEISHALGISPAKLVEHLDYALKNNRLPDDVEKNSPPRKIGRPLKKK